MMQATIIKTSTDDYIINIDENESDIPEAPFSCWIVALDEMNSLYNIRADESERKLAAAQRTIEAQRNAIIDVGNALGLIMPERVKFFATEGVKAVEAQAQRIKELEGYIDAHNKRVLEKIDKGSV